LVTIPAVSDFSVTFSLQRTDGEVRFLTVREVAARLKVCRATVYRMIHEGRLPAVRVSSGAIRVVAGLGRPDPVL
jgi:excisionase family DNA binding protein